MDSKSISSRIVLILSAFEPLFVIFPVSSTLGVVAALKTAAVPFLFLSQLSNIDGSTADAV